MVFPKGFVTALILGSTTARLQVHQRDAISVFRNHCWGISLKEGSNNLVGRVVLTHETNRAIAGNEPISGLQFGNAELVFVPNTTALIIALPTFVAAFYPASLLCFQQRQMLVGSFLGCGAVDFRELSVERR